MATIGLFGISGFHWNDRNRIFCVEFFSASLKLLIGALENEIKPVALEECEFEAREN